MRKYDPLLHRYVVDYIISSCLGASPRPTIVDDVDAAELARTLQDPHQLRRFVNDLRAAVNAADPTLTVLSSEDPALRQALEAADDALMIVISPTEWEETEACVAQMTVLVTTNNGLRYGGRVTLEALNTAKDRLRRLKALEQLTEINAIARLQLLTGMRNTLTGRAQAEQNNDALGYLDLIGDKLKKLQKTAPTAVGKDRTQLGRECILVLGNLDAVAGMLLLSIGDIWHQAWMQAQVQ